MRSLIKFRGASEQIERPSTPVAAERGAVEASDRVVKEHRLGFAPPAVVLALGRRVAAEREVAWDAADARRRCLSSRSRDAFDDAEYAPCIQH